MKQNLLTRIRHHDWDLSLDSIGATRALIERLELLKEIKDLPQNELSNVFKEINPKITAQIISFIQASRT